MTPPPALPAGIATAAAWCLLGLAAWERSVRRRRVGDLAWGPLPAPAAGLHAPSKCGSPPGSSSACCSGCGPRWRSPGPLHERRRRAWLLLAGVPGGRPRPAGLGRAAAEPGAFPAALRWLLAPVHGLAAWILWLRGLPDTRRVAQRRERAAPPPCRRPRGRPPRGCAISPSSRSRR